MDYDIPRDLISAAEKNSAATSPLSDGNYYEMNGCNRAPLAGCISLTDDSDGDRAMALFDTSLTNLAFIESLTDKCCSTPMKPQPQPLSEIHPKSMPRLHSLSVFRPLSQPQDQMQASSPPLPHPHSQTPPQPPIRRSHLTIRPPEAPCVTSDGLLTPTQAPLTPTQAPLTPTQAPLTPTQAPLTPTQAPLTPTQASLTPIQASLTPTQAPLTPTQASLTPTQAPLIPTQAPLTPIQSPPAKPIATPSCTLNTSSSTSSTLNSSDSPAHASPPTSTTPTYAVPTPTTSTPATPTPATPTPATPTPATPTPATPTPATPTPATPTPATPTPATPTPATPTPATPTPATPTPATPTPATPTSTIPLLKASLQTIAEDSGFQSDNEHQSTSTTTSHLLPNTTSDLPRSLCPTLPITMGLDLRPTANSNPPPFGDRHLETETNANDGYVKPLSSVFAAETYPNHNGTTLPTSVASRIDGVSDSAMAACPPDHCDELTKCSSSDSGIADVPTYDSTSPVCEADDEYVGLVRLPLLPDTTLLSRNAVASGDNATGDSVEDRRISERSLGVNDGEEERNGYVALHEVASPSH